MAHAVYLSGSGVRFDVAPEQSLLEAGLAAGLPMPYGCTSGSCAACRVRVESGVVTHRAPPQGLSQAELDAGYVLMCLAQPQSDLRLALHQPQDVSTLRPETWPCRVLERRWLSDDVIGLWLKLPRAERPFRHLPGQYIDFLLEDGRRRSFSVASAPNDATLELHLRVAPGGRFANWVAHEMQDKAMLRFEGPLGAFYLRDDHRPSLLLAGGTGFSPIKAIIEGALANGDDRPMHLYWGARHRNDLYMHELVRQWVERHPNLRYTPVLAEPDPEWTGARGLPHAQLLADYPELSGQSLYMSGPPAMVRNGKALALAAGLDADHLYYDSFEDAHTTWPGLG
jgi:CDP-4-dehydro-6-deoxyglucose reductase